MHHGLDLYHRFLDFLTAYNSMLVLNSYSSSFRKGFHRVDSLFAFLISLLLRTVFTLAILMGKWNALRSALHSLIFHLAAHDLVSNSHVESRLAYDSRRHW